MGNEYVSFYIICKLVEAINKDQIIPDHFDRDLIS